MSFALRQAFVSDIQDIMNVEAEAFVTPIREKEEVFVERITVFPQGFFVLIDEDTNKVCGYFASERWESYALTSDDFLLDHSARERHKNNGSYVYISSMGILQAYRGKGLGTYLFTESCNTLAKTLTDVKAFVLLVNEQWKSALKIYREYGFVQKGVLEKFFPQYQTQTGVVCVGDGIVMEKVL